MIPFIEVKLGCDRINDWDSFHDVCTGAFGFPDFYGRNMDAWIDCLTNVDDPEGKMTTVHAPSNGIVIITLIGADGLKERQREIFDAIVECSSFVNFRRLKCGDSPILALSLKIENNQETGKHEQT